jgi:hypothetical protein
MRRRLHHGDESLAGQISFKAAKFLRRHDDDFIAAAHRDVLRTFGAHTSNKFAETRLGVLQQPMIVPPIAPAAPQSRLR